MTIKLELKTEDLGIIAVTLYQYKKGIEKMLQEFDFSNHPKLIKFVDMEFQTVSNALEKIEEALKS